MSLRIHVLTNLFPPAVLGGYELLTADVVARMRTRGHDVTVLTTGHGEREPGLARVLRLARPFGTDAARDRGRHLFTALWNRVALERVLDSLPPPDAVLVMSMRRLGVEPLRAYTSRGVPFVVTVNDDWPVAYVPSRRPGLAGAVDRLPFWSHTWRGVGRPAEVVYLSGSIRAMVRGAGAPLGEGQLCAQGVDMGLFARRPHRAMRAALRLVFVGRLHPSKAPDIAIDALARLRARGVEASLVVIGAPVTPKYGAELRARAERLGVASAVQWRGLVPRDELPAAYADADVMLYPLRGEEEAQGLTYMEAISCGVPVVAFPTAGARELLDTADVVQRASRCDGDAFADAITSLSVDPERQAALVARAHAWLAEHASLDRYVSVLERTLEEAAGSKARSWLRQPTYAAHGPQESVG
ncbi:MAG TPA: glycosyltransferase family 4 protein [Polyangiaceae bacterium]|jgi:glycosyltransferase involved in cell wall biosynthesis|nr:glycosyltransferase family 4 protein [Polyangiaceae bacterium]